MADYKNNDNSRDSRDFLSFESKLSFFSSLVPSRSFCCFLHAGMNQFKEYYQGIKTMKEIGATSCQKCLRTNDIDNIGDSRHSHSSRCWVTLLWWLPLARCMHLSNGAYFSPEHLACLLIACIHGLHSMMMRQLRSESLGVEDHITRLGERTNFWAAGPTGPCGPCSEIYFDQGPGV